MQAKYFLVVVSWATLVCLLGPICVASHLEETTTVESVTDRPELSINGTTSNLTSLHNEETEHDQDESDGCDGRISSFVRSFDSTDFLPDDYEEISDSIHQKDLYRQIHHINDTLALGQRLFDYGQKLKANKDIESTVLYLSSVFMDKIYAAQISAQCSADLLNVLTGIRNQELWALKCTYNTSYWRLIRRRKII